MDLFSVWIRFRVWCLVGKLIFGVTVSSRLYSLGRRGSTIGFLYRLLFYRRGFESERTVLECLVGLQSVWGLGPRYPSFFLSSFQFHTLNTKVPKKTFPSKAKEKHTTLRMKQKRIHTTQKQGKGKELTSVSFALENKTPTPSVSPAPKEKSERKFKEEKLPCPRNSFQSCSGRIESCGVPRGPSSLSHHQLNKSRSSTLHQRSSSFFFRVRKNHRHSRYSHHRSPASHSRRTRLRAGSSVWHS